MSLIIDKDILEINNCVVLKDYTVREGLYGLKFTFKGRTYDIIRKSDTTIYLKRLDKQFSTIMEALYYIISYNDDNGLKTLKSGQIAKDASVCRCLHYDWWIDQYKEYLSINELNHSERQIKAFYSWWFNNSEYKSTPHFNLEKKS